MKLKFFLHQYKDIKQNDIIKDINFFKKICVNVHGPILHVHPQRWIQTANQYILSSLKTL